jgi:hypothetical protein
MWGYLLPVATVCVMFCGEALRVGAPGQVVEPVLAEFVAHRATQLPLDMNRR